MIIQLSEPKLMIEPFPALIMPGTTACAAKKECLRLTPIDQSHCSGVTLFHSMRRSLAALLTRASAGPWAASKSRMVAW